MKTTSTTSHRLAQRPDGAPVPLAPGRGPAALAAAGGAFIAYPALRPYADETTLAGAEAMASGAWVLAHLLGMAGFVLVALGMTMTAQGQRAMRWAAALAWLGAALVLPFYGAETFGLRVIGQHALAENSAEVLALAEELRMGATQITMFGIGLLAVAGAGVALAIATWRGGALARTAGLATGAGLVLYLPQFFGTPVLRVGHGLLLGAGLLLLAAGLAQRPGGRTRR